MEETVFGWKPRVTTLDRPVLFAIEQLRLGLQCWADGIKPNLDVKLKKTDVDLRDRRYIKLSGLAAVEGIAVRYSVEFMEHNVSGEVYPHGFRINLSVPGVPLSQDAVHISATRKIENNNWFARIADDWVDKAQIAVKNRLPGQAA